MARKKTKSKDKEPEQTSGPRFKLVDEESTSQDEQQSEEQEPVMECDVTQSCVNCRDCDVKNFGLCTNPNAREQLDFWNGIIFKPKEFGCVHWSPRSD